MRSVAIGLCVLVLGRAGVAADGRPQAPQFPFDKGTALGYQREYANWARLQTSEVNEIGMVFAFVPPGSFLMGSPDDEPGHNSGGYDETQHRVTLSKPFYLSRFETTVGQFRRFVEATGYVTDGERKGGGHAHDDRAEWKHRPGVSWRKPGFAGPFELNDDQPVVHVSHADSLAFCRWLMKVAPPKHPGARYDLPTEAQWEWAARAGSGTRYWWGSDEDRTGSVANVGDRTLKQVHPNWPRTVMDMDDGHAFVAPAASFKANAFGLHSMLGNVWEFCSTRYGPYPRGAVVDPGDGDPSRGFAVRGGGWSNIAADVRCASRNADPPHFCHSNLGFRVALVLDGPPETAAANVLSGLREFYRRTARDDGSFQPGLDPEYLGMSDCAYSDLAAVTYAVTIHKTFGWKLPHEEKTAEFLLSRQKPSGEFYNVAGTVDPASAQARVYNTTQGLVALHALGIKPRYDPLPVFDDVLKQDYKTLPAYATSFFPLAYLAHGSPVPGEVDQKVRATMLQGDDGYLNDHIAATFHAAHYHGLFGEPTPKAALMLTRMLREQKPDGGWLLNQPARDRHATYDAVFTLKHLGHGRADCQAAIERAARWVLSCRNADGGFGHFPGSTSDADAIYFHVGTLVLAGVLPPVQPLPKDPHLLSWGHLMPLPATGGERVTLTLPSWVGAVAFSPDGKLLATGSGDGHARLWNAATGKLVAELSDSATNAAHDNCIVSAAFAPDGRTLATGSFDHTARLWDVQTGKLLATLIGHGGAVMSVAFSPEGGTVATGSVDGTVKLWHATGVLQATLAAHKSWVNAVAFHPAGKLLASGSSDGTIRLWDLENVAAAVRTLPATQAEVRSLAFSSDGKLLATGMRYGMIKTWETQSWQERLSIAGHEEDVWSIAFTPDSTTLITGNGAWNQPGQVKLWDAASGKPRGTLPQSGEVLCLAVSPDGKSLAAGCRDGTATIAPIRIDP